MGGTARRFAENAAPQPPLTHRSQQPPKARGIRATQLVHRTTAGARTVRRRFCGYGLVTDQTSTALVSEGQIDVAAVTGAVGDLSDQRGRHLVRGHQAGACNGYPFATVASR